MSPVQFDQCLVAQRNSLYRQAIGLTRNPEQARDLVQESLLKALLKRDQFQPGTDLGAWLKTILRNNFINGFRRQRLSRKLEGDIEVSSMAVAKVHTGEDPIASLDNRAVKEILARLQPVLQDAIILHDEGFKYHEIAERVGVPLGTVKSRIHQARKELSKALGGRLHMN
ncbi:MAG TPA: sigma-70 family RNA polymerase sigma factor [Flavobacteriales bacterium]|nr:sigma-70 family RNA polymerase sigma factor [Flavobacteriales bacterium]